MMIFVAGYNTICICCYATMLFADDLEAVVRPHADPLDQLAAVVRFFFLMKGKKCKAWGRKPKQWTN